MADTWTVAKAKAKLSEVIALANRVGPQTTPSARLRPNTTTSPS